MISKKIYRNYCKIINNAKFTQNYDSKLLEIDLNLPDSKIFTPINKISQKSENKKSKNSNAKGKRKFYSRDQSRRKNTSDTPPVGK